MRNIDVTPRPLAELASHLSDAATKRLDAVVDAGRRLGQGRTIFNITPSAAADSGVAEAVETITALALDAGIDTRWYQLDMPAPFRVLSERLDNWLHGYDGDGGVLRDKERDLYEHVLSSNAENLVDEISNGDIVVLHEAATAGLAQAFSEAGAWVVWRCHGGTEDLNEHSQLAWSFLEPYLDWANRMVFTRDVYRPPFAPPDSCDVIAPSIVPDSPKNRVLDLDESLSIVRLAGIFDGVAPFDAVPFIREDGRPGVIEKLDGVMLAGGPVPQGARVVTQVSRWSALKGNVQLIEAFAADRELPTTCTCCWWGRLWIVRAGKLPGWLTALVASRSWLPTTGILLRRPACWRRCLTPMRYCRRRWLSGCTWPLSQCLTAR